ncbi:MAG: hypothetical protein RRC34_14165 [Lentisphaeria bacterium]|nr:hypothetical protein [Lentisphaeria bacterium]
MAVEKHHPSSACHPHSRAEKSLTQADEKARRLAAAGKMVEGMAELLALTSARHQMTSTDMPGVELTVRLDSPLDELVDQADRIVSEQAAVSAEFRKATIRGRKLPAPNKMKLPNLKKDPKHLSFDIRYSLFICSSFPSFKRGHVYCYACQSSACEHSRPLVPDQVFAGYEATGTALWVELYSLL